MGCMTCGGKNKSAKPKTYSPKKSSTYKQGASSQFGSPKVRISFSSRGR